MRVVREGQNICPGADKTYLTVFVEGEEKFKFYTPFPNVRWEVVEKTGSDPTGEYWISIIYINTGTKHPDYDCAAPKYANVYARPSKGKYRWIQGAIIGIALNKKSYEGAPSYKLVVKTSSGRIIEYLITDTIYGNYSLRSEAECKSKFISAAYPGSVKIEEIIPITGGYEYEFRVFDERGLVFSKILEEIPTVDDYCILTQEKCPPGTCECDCHLSYTCCYGKDGIVKKIIYK